MVIRVPKGSEAVYVGHGMFIPRGESMLPETPPPMKTQQMNGITNLLSAVSTSIVVTVKDKMLKFPVPKAKVSFKCKNTGTEITGETDMSGKVTMPYNCVSCTGIYGDLNGDGIVNVVDRMYIEQYFAGIRSLDACQLLRADVNGDGVVNVDDATLMTNYFMELPGEKGKTGQPIPNSIDIEASAGLFGEMYGKSTVNISSTDTTIKVEILTEPKVNSKRR